jgi:endonuclease/exonuclease/phosphatase family metal-dependent hydrolase
MKNILKLNAIFILILLLITSCDDEGAWQDYEPPQVYKPVIFSIAPTEATLGGTVVIEGFNFSDVTSVKVGPTEAAAFTAAYGSITVKVPENASVGVQPMTVTNKDGSATVSINILPKPVPVNVSIKVMSLGIANKNANLGNIANLIERYNPDLVVLREVDSYNTRTDRTIDQGKVVADQVGMNYHFAAGWAYSGGEYGPAILSRFPIKQRSEPTLLPGGTTRPFGYVTVEVAAGFDLIFAAAHLDDGSNATVRDRDQPLQSQKILDLLSTTQLPVIMGGNFYFKSQSSPHMQTLYSQFSPGCEGCAFNYPANVPAFVADHIMFKEGMGVKMEVLSYTDSNIPADIMNNRKPLISEIKITRD